MTIKKQHYLGALVLALSIHALPLLSYQQIEAVKMGAAGLGQEGLTVGVGLAGSFDTSRYQKGAEESEETEDKQDQEPPIEEQKEPEKLEEKEAVEPIAVVEDTPTEQDFEDSTENLADPVDELAPEPLPSALPSERKSMQLEVSASTSENTSVVHVEINDSEKTLKEAVSKKTEPLNSPVSSLALVKATGTGTSDTSGGNPALRQTYNTKILTRIARYKRYPRSARKEGVTGTVTIAFGLDYRGRVTHSSISESSGDPRLDREALELLIRAEPFPPIPEEMSEDSIDFTLPIEFSLNTHRKIF